jgi:hypothetical protein
LLFSSGGESIAAEEKTKRDWAKRKYDSKIRGSLVQQLQQRRRRSPTESRRAPRMVEGAASWNKDMTADELY